MLRLDAALEVLGLGLGRLPYVYVGFKEAAQSLFIIRPSVD